MRRALLLLWSATTLAAFATHVSGQRPAGCGTSAAARQMLLERGHAPVNGLRIYYEIHGRRGGVPLVLLHGGGSTIESTFGRLLPCLARHRQVIAVEEQGHGRRSDRSGPWSSRSTHSS